jgi:hypothetical protein
VGGEALARRSPCRPTALLIAMLVVVGACGRLSNSDEAPRDSGVTGFTVVDAGCPPTPAQEQCPDRPLVAHLVVARSDSGVVITRVDTGSDGAFRIPLDQGSYTLTATTMTGAPMPSSLPISFDVHEHQFTAVIVRFDSGVR